MTTSPPSNCAASRARGRDRQAMGPGPVPQFVESSP
eukprot:CAMPEP_0117538196 /NCGR_PEP_ID=MMETSP0784-20121206/42356_1 /TAXON_ID=39447 /ORGANISM="" /LENGTH=35 /DNA_ID= /DNA_START= /DNA_END= /DNA_ORIENTATION=